MEQQGLILKNWSEMFLIQEGEPKQLILAKFALVHQLENLMSLPKEI